MTVATLIPASLFGLYAGEVADSMAKRVAIAIAYAVAGVACFLIPTIFGTDVPALFALVFVVAAFSQLAGPAENSVLPLVASEEQLASATSMMGLASSIGTAAGTAVIAPVLLKLIGARAVFYVAGGLLLAATTRVLHIYSKRDRGTGGTLPRPTPTTSRRALDWVFQHPGVATMVGVSILSGVSNVILATLAPVYVHDVLGSNPAETVYVMAPAGIALTFSLWCAPWFIRLAGERRTAAAGVGLMIAGLVGLGLVQADIGAVVDRIDPLRAVAALGVPIDRQFRTAAMFCIPVGLGIGLTDNAVKTYINRRVPFAFQGRTFAVRNTLENAIAIVPLLTVSAIASVVGVSTVLVLTSVTIYALILLLIHLSTRFGADAVSPRTMVTKTFWESDEELVSGEGG